MCASNGCQKVLGAKLEPQAIGLKLFQTVPTRREPDSWGRSLLSEMEASSTQHGACLPRPPAMPSGVRPWLTSEHVLRCVQSTPLEARPAEVAAMWPRHGDMSFSCVVVVLVLVRA